MALTRASREEERFLIQFFATDQHMTPNLWHPNLWRRWEISVHSFRGDPGAGMASVNKAPVTVSWCHKVMMPDSEAYKPLPSNFRIGRRMGLAMITLLWPNDSRRLRLLSRRTSAWQDPKAFSPPIVYPPAQPITIFLWLMEVIWWCIVSCVGSPWVRWNSRSCPYIFWEIGCSEAIEESHYDSLKMTLPIESRLALWTYDRSYPHAMCLYLIRKRTKLAIFVTAVILEADQTFPKMGTSWHFGSALNKHLCRIWSHKICDTDHCDVVLSNICRWGANACLSAVSCDQCCHKLSEQHSFWPSTHEIGRFLPWLLDCTRRLSGNLFPMLCNRTL